MRVRGMLSQDVELAERWREGHGVPYVDPKALPPTGAVCESLDRAPLAMAWLYLTNSKLCYLAWPTTQPGLRPRLAHEALTLVCTELMALAQLTGQAYVISTSDSRGLSKLLVQLGMTQQKNPHDLLVKELNK